ncbi:TetR/AcrR family transcriptional regulator [Rathayibacter sp. VKM Ac-2630]|uniref:TetR/AcrR family transcriptional regulator n=1 Tax=Rathayibacter sp. VKM Ac-2630 TaxID=1938617 RepID=UPI001F24FFA7|nr:helix-turn-helix domain-containing protein [Rathayibacter sp. VKM Ac-2630]
MQPPVSAYSLRRADAVLEATLDVLAEVGFARLTVDMIATRAHASKATIYRRWATKTELVRAAAALVEVETIPAEVGAEPAEALRAVLESLRSMTVGRLGRLVSALTTAAVDDPGIRATVHEELVIPLHRGTAAALDELRDAGVIDAHADTALAARALIALTVDRAVATGTAATPAELEALLAAWVLPVLAPAATGRRTKGPTAGPG